jgi:hypothetical protein
VDEDECAILDAEDAGTTEAAERYVKVVAEENVQGNSQKHTSSLRGRLVEPRGVEPLTFSLRTRRSTN